MTTVEEIREDFAAFTKDGTALPLTTLPEQYPAFAVKIPEGLGVAIPVEDTLEVAERFNSCRFHTGLLSLNDESQNYLLLTSSFKEFRYEFAAFCAEFVEPGENGANRINILSSPSEWWDRWKELVGNAGFDQKAYSVIAEMMVLLQKLEADSSAVWTVTHSGSHDIECTYESCEVKSTLKRYGAEVIIAGQHQLEHKKPLFMYFCRMEESLEGTSINDLRNKLISMGYEEGKLELELLHLGYEKGSSARNKKYKVLEKRKYLVDDSFPRITGDMFKDGKFPNGIKHIQYTVDLDLLEYTVW